MQQSNPILSNIIREYGSHFPEKKEWSLKRHINDGLELVYITRGEVAWQYENSRIVSPAETLSFSWPGQYHCSAAPIVPAAEMHWLIIPLEASLNLHADLGFSAEESRKIINGFSQIQPQIIRVNQQIQFYFREIIDQLTRVDPTESLRRIIPLAQLLLMEISRQPPITGDRTLTTSETRLVVEQFLKRMKKECDSHWSLGEMCRICGLGRTRFASLVKEITGESPVKTLNRYRIDRSRKLLQQTDQSITAIALECGFPSSQYFATVFNAYHGCSPGEYRRNGLA